MTPHASGEAAGGANNDFPKFSSGDSAGKVLSATYQNKLIAGVERANRMTFGPGSDVIQFGPFSLKKKRRAAATPESSGSMYVVSLSNVDCDAGTADGTILRYPCGSTAIEGTIPVSDVLGCFLEGPEELLNGVKAWVSKLEGGDGDYDCVYGIVSMCCATYGCS